MRLADVLRHCGVRDAMQAGRHVCFRGPKHELPQGAPATHACTQRCDACGQLPAAAWHSLQQANNARVWYSRVYPLFASIWAGTRGPSEQQSVNCAGRDGSYGTSIPAFKALDAASDVILAYRHNGRLLTPDHVRNPRCPVYLHTTCCLSTHNHWMTASWYA